MSSENGARSCAFSYYEIVSVLGSINWIFWKTPRPTLCGAAIASVMAQSTFIASGGTVLLVIGTLSRRRYGKVALHSDGLSFAQLEGLDSFGLETRAVASGKNSRGHGKDRTAEQW